MPRLVSIQEISEETGLEESLLRFYESEYPSELPDKILQGDMLAFDVCAIEAFQRIHDLHQGEQLEPTAGEGRYARVIAVTSGKGGVGKTNIALNLAIEMQRFGKMCIVLDADMGMANVHLLAGIPAGNNIRDIISSGRDIVDIIAEGPEGIGIIPGGGGILSLADSSRHDRMKVIDALRTVEKEAEVIIVDTGAGMGSSVRDFLACADDLLFVLSPDITSLADAYGLLKALHHEKMSERPVYSVINMVETLKQAAGVAHRFSSCAHEFLGRNVENIGYILKDSTVAAATVRRTPYSVFKPQARVSKNTRNIAAALLKNEESTIRVSSAFGRYMNLLRAQKM